LSEANASVAQPFRAGGRGSSDPGVEGNAPVARPFRAGARGSPDPREADTSSAHDVRAREERAEAFARQLLLRWGVVFRDLVARETIAPPWRELLGALRRLEARGEIRGGRFVSGFLGEQFARPEAIELVRAVRRDDAAHVAVRVAAADPLNLVGIIVPGQRVSPTAAAVVDLLGPADDRTSNTVQKVQEVQEARGGRRFSAPREPVEITNSRKSLNH